MKVIIAGSRNIEDYKIVEEAVKKSGFKVTEVVSGGARGVDTLGEKYASENNLSLKVFKAEWGNLDVPKYKIKKNKYGKLYNIGAGFERNELMGKYADALIAIWDGKSNGTKHMIQCMRKSGKKIFVESVR
jgi:hypothetical protein